HSIGERAQVGNESLVLDIVVITPDHGGTFFHCNVSGHKGVLGHREVSDSSASSRAKRLPAEGPIPRSASLKMTGGATAAVLGRRGHAPILTVGDILPLSIADVLVICAEALSLSFDEDGPRCIRYQPSILIV